MNTTISNFKLKRDYPDKPEDFPKKSMVRQNTKLWYKVTQLHLRDLEDMEDSSPPCVSPCQWSLTITLARSQSGRNSPL
jgi:hypothetical protein